jgi:hypothetical protein
LHRVFHGLFDPVNLRTLIGLVGENVGVVEGIDERIQQLVKLLIAPKDIQSADMISPNPQKERDLGVVNQ